MVFLKKVRCSDCHSYDLFVVQDDRYFLSGSLDGKLRLWSIPDKKVALWNEVLGQSKLITAASFCLGGKFAVCGTYDGRCIFYSTEVRARMSVLVSLINTCMSGISFVACYDSK